MYIHSELLTSVLDNLPFDNVLIACEGRFLLIKFYHF